MSETSLSLSHYPGRRIGRTIVHADVVASTNDVAMAAGRRGEEEGFVVVADVQTAGRGRLGRHWQAAAGTSLLFSVLFHPPEPLVRTAPRVPMVCGLGLVEAVRDVTGIPVLLKWPNDLIVEPSSRADSWKKLAGMLTEIELPHDALPALIVVGIGLNVNVGGADLASLAPNASSLLALGGREVNRGLLLEKLLGAIDRRYAALLDGVDPLPEWHEALAWLGRSVEVSAPEGCFVGVAEGVDDDGALMVRTAAGDTRRMTAGDVSLRLAR